MTLRKIELANGTIKELQKLSTGNGYAVITVKPNKDMWAESFNSLSEAECWFEWA